jgi:hypothetical protein
MIKATITNKAPINILFERSDVSPYPEKGTSQAAEYYSTDALHPV